MLNYSLGWIGGAAIMYAVTGAYIYSIGVPLNQWLEDDAKVTLGAIFGWPMTVRRVMRAGTAVPGDAKA